MKRDLTGQMFGRLTALTENGRNKRGLMIWLCKCECGKEVSVVSGAIISGNTSSCGCFKKEVLIKRNTVHGLSKNGNGAKKRLYNIWVRMKQRCNDENASDYDRYGGRGIKVCTEWTGFDKFHYWATSNGYSDDLSIERKDVNGGYEPGNCSWITIKGQANNKRNNHFITYQTETKTLAEWSQKFGIGSSLIRYRLKQKWPLERVFNK